MIARYSNGTQSVYLTDALGSVIAQLKDDHSSCNQYGYSPYGMTVKGNNGQANQATDDQGNASQYTARENDGTGLYYYRARYYMPSCGRFISEDPIGTQGGINLYGYVGGDPINATDPMGLAQCDVDAALDVVPSQFPGVDKPRTRSASLRYLQVLTDDERKIGAAYSENKWPYSWFWTWSLYYNVNYVNAKSGDPNWGSYAVLEAVIHEYGHAAKWPDHGYDHNTKEYREYRKRVDDIFDILEGPYQQKRKEYCEPKKK
jgi:RHS repeat-associated protein